MNVVNSTYIPVSYLPADTNPILSANDATVLKTASVLDTYQRSDGSSATRLDFAQPVKAEETITEKTAEQSDEKKFREVLHQFVGQTFFGQMLKSIRANQEKNPYFHGGRAEEIFQGQLDMQLTDEMTKASSKTLSEPMYKLMTAKKG